MVEYLVPKVKIDYSNKIDECDLMVEHSDVKDFLEYLDEEE